jgi:hypothetical protein
VNKSSINHEPLDHGVTAFSSAVEPAKPSLSPEEITALASENGVIDGAKLIKLFSDRTITYAAGLEVVEAVARKVGSNNMLKDTEAGEGRDSPQVANMSVQESEVPVLSNEDTEGVRIKAEPANKSKVTDKATTTQPDATSPPSTSAPNMPNPPPLKRPLSNDRLSRESTPSKKAKLAELKAKKAALVAANQEKARKKLAAEKALEEERKRRAAEEDELLREIAEAEKEGMELDEETAELVKMREMEEDEV